MFRRTRAAAARLRRRLLPSRERWGWLAAAAAVVGAATVLLGPARGPVPAGAPIAASELRVIDGDTIWWGDDRVRLIGYDAPEVASPQCASERSAGRAATAALRQAIGAASSIELAPISRRDRWGRVLARLYLDGEDVADRMIGNGLARVYHGGPRAGWCQ